MNTSVMKLTPCILHLKFMHIVEQCIVPPFVISTTKVLMRVTRYCGLLANLLLIKLWVVSELIRMYKGCLSAFPVTHNVWQPNMPFSVFREIWGGGVNDSCSMTFSSPFASTISSSSSIMHKEYSRLFLHLWLGTNLSSHLKHCSWALLSSKSLGVIV